MRHWLPLSRSSNSERDRPGAALEMKQAKDKLDAELPSPKPTVRFRISDLKLRSHVRENDCRPGYAITNLSTQIEDRVKLYNLTMEERVRIANRVKATDEAWDNLNIVKESIFHAIERGGMPPPPRDLGVKAAISKEPSNESKRALRFGILVAILLLPVVVASAGANPVTFAGTVAFRKTWRP